MRSDKVRFKKRISGRYRAISKSHSRYIKLPSCSFAALESITKIFVKGFIRDVLNEN